MAKREMGVVGSKVDFEIKELKVSDLKPDPYQTKKHTEENAAAIRASLEDHGQMATLLVRKGKGHVIAGNERLRIMKEELGWKTVWCWVRPFTDKEARMASERMNRTGEMGFRDDAAMADLFKFLEQEGEDVGRLGYNEQEVRKIITSAERSLKEFSKDDGVIVGEHKEDIDDTGVNGAKGDGFWFYVEYYGDGERFERIVKILKPVMKGKHEIDPDAFENMATTFVKGSKK